MTRSWNETSERLFLSLLLCPHSHTHCITATHTPRYNHTCSHTHCITATHTTLQPHTLHYSHTHWVTATHTPLQPHTPRYSHTHPIIATHSALQPHTLCYSHTHTPLQPHTPRYTALQPHTLRYSHNTMLQPHILKLVYRREIEADWKLTTTDWNANLTNQRTWPLLVFRNIGSENLLPLAFMSPCW